MTLEEAIEHSEQVADSYNNTVPDCDCAKQHRQLAEWLKELKYYREEWEEFETFNVKRIITTLKPINTIIGKVRIIEKPKKIFE